MHIHCLKISVYDGPLAIVAALSAEPVAVCMETNSAMMTRHINMTQHTERELHTVQEARTQCDKRSFAEAACTGQH
jgi:hypothetical protein